MPWKETTPMIEKGWHIIGLESGNSATQPDVFQS